MYINVNAFFIASIIKEARNVMAIIHLGLSKDENGL